MVNGLIFNQGRVKPVQARKTDDSKILELLRAGKNQVAIAKELGVSPVAIHKRLKKIMPPVPSLEGLTPKQKRFCELVAEGKSRTTAAMEAYDVSSRNSAKALQSELMDNPKIGESIEALMDYHGLTRSHRVKRLKGLVDHVDPNVSLRALDQSWKLDGYPKSETGPAAKPNVVINLNKEELNLILDGLRHLPEGLVELPPLGQGEKALVGNMADSQPVPGDGEGQG